jgi:hypothetical protein
VGASFGLRVWAVLRTLFGALELQEALRALR